MHREEAMMAEAEMGCLRSNPRRALIRRGRNIPRPQTSVCVCTCVRVLMQVRDSMCVSVCRTAFDTEHPSFLVTYLFFLFIHLIVCVSHAHAGTHILQHAYGDQKKTSGNWFSPSTEASGDGTQAIRLHSMCFMH